MELEERIAQVADILAPAVDWDLAGVDELIADADEARAQWVEDLRLACDGVYAAKFFGPDPVTGEPRDPDEEAGEDPVLVAVERLSGEIADLQSKLRHVVAYAREFSPPGVKYTLEQLATAARMSVSGVRTMYDTGTVNFVAYELRVGAVKRGADLDSRWRVSKQFNPAMARGEVQEMSDEKPAPPGFPLGKWVTEQRRRHENKELSSRRIAAPAELLNTADADPENPKAESP